MWRELFEKERKEEEMMLEIIQIKHQAYTTEQSNPPKEKGKLTKRKKEKKNEWDWKQGESEKEKEKKNIALLTNN